MSGGREGLAQEQSDEPLVGFKKLEQFGWKQLDERKEYFLDESSLFFGVFLMFLLLFFIIRSANG